MPKAKANKKKKTWPVILAAFLVFGAIGSLADSEDTTQMPDESPSISATAPAPKATTKASSDSKVESTVKPSKSPASTVSPTPSKDAAPSPSNESTKAPTESPTVSASVEKDKKVDPNPTPDASAESYIGNVNSNIFHSPLCKTLPKEANRVYFSTRQQAIDAGHRPCQKCKP